MVIVSELASSSSFAPTITVHALASLPAPQPGFSKSGALVNVRAPVSELIVNKSLSVPPDTE